MAEEHGSREKTEQATPRRLQQARERGDVARSRELNTMTLLLVASGSLLVMGEREQLFDPYAPMTFFVDAVLHMLGTLTPFLAAMALVALIAPILMGGRVFSVQVLGFKWERLNPLKGMGRVFGLKGLMEMTKAFAKFALVAGASVLLLWLSMGELLNVGNGALMPSLANAAWLIGLLDDQRCHHRDCRDRRPLSNLGARPQAEDEPARGEG